MRGTKSGRGAVLPLILALILAFCAAAPAQKKPDKDSEKNPQYQYEKGVVALRYGLTDEAIRYGNLATSLDPKHYGGWNLLGNAYYKKGDYGQSAAAFERALALKPDSAEAHTNLGMAYLENGDLDKAEAQLTKATLAGGDALAAFNLAKIHYGQKKYDLSLDEVQKSIKKNGRSPAAYNLKGAVLNELGRYPEAVGAFQAGLVLAPEDVTLQINLGVAYTNVNEPAKAKAVFEKVIPLIEDPALKAQVEGYLKALKER